MAIEEAGSSRGGMTFVDDPRHFKPQQTFARKNLRYRSEILETRETGYISKTGATLVKVDKG